MVCYFSAVFCGQDRTLSSVQTYAHATMGSLLWTHKSHWKPLSNIPEKAQVCMAKCEFCLSTSFKLQKPTCFFWYLLHMHVGVQRIFYGVYQPFCLPQVKHVAFYFRDPIDWCFFSVGHTCTYNYSHKLHVVWKHDHIIHVGVNKFKVHYASMIWLTFPASAYYTYM